MNSMSPPSDFNNCKACLFLAKPLYFCFLKSLLVAGVAGEEEIGSLDETQ